MIGILCNRRKKNLYTEEFHSLFKQYNFRNNISIIVFDLSDINVTNRTVSGNLISDEIISQVTIEVPKIIFNFSFQQKKADIKKLRSIHEMEKVLLVNEVNQFNQWMIMEILSSSDIFKNYLMPYKIVEQNTTHSTIEKVNSFLLIPQNGSNLSKTILVKNKNSRFDVYQNARIQRVNNKIIQSILSPNSSKKPWLSLDVPEIIIEDNKPLVQRIYFQREAYGEWTILTGRFLTLEYSGYRVNINNYYGILLAIVKYISNFIPSLGNCYVDLVFDVRGNPYFLHFGGWDQDYIIKNENIYMKNIFARNLLIYSMYYIEKERGE
jgi:hypothetical protein